MPDVNGPQIMSNNVQFELNRPPADGITSLNFAPNSSQYLLATSWDMSVSLYDIVKNERIHYYKHDCPVLSATFLYDKHYCCSAGTDGTIILKNISRNQNTSLGVIGTQNLGTKCTLYSHAHNLIFGGSWDTTVNVYDPNISNFSASNLVKSLPNQGKVFAMDLLSANKLAVATSNNEIFIWDLRYFNSPILKRKSTLSDQIRDIAAFPKGSLKEGFVSASLAGRASVEYIDRISSQLVDKFAFKCHREKDAEKSSEIIHPVNSVSFHKKHQTFATGGSDGFVNFWDPYAKQRIFQLPKYNVGVVALTLGNDISRNSVIAVGCSYNYELDVHPVEVPMDKIYIRNLDDSKIIGSSDTVAEG